MIKIDWIAFCMFQYISCCSLSLPDGGTGVPLSGFNTSHVVVYPLSTFSIYVFCLSFNTSHVVVYQSKVSFVVAIEMFQYISCCSLSNAFRNPRYNKITFQYISCCSLSAYPCQPASEIPVSIHLML